VTDCETASSTAVLDRYPVSWRGGIERVRQVWRVALHPKFRPEVRLLRPFIPRDGGCLDIGANHGRFALELARVGCRVLAFEPLGFNLAIIRPASVLAGRVRIEPIALGEADGEAVMYVPLRRDGRPRHGSAFVAADDAAALERAGGERVVRQRVPIRRLDDLDLAWVGAIGFIKMDVEGHEASVLRGGGRVLAEHHPSILMEVSGGDSGLEALTELAGRGYVIRDLDLRDEGRWLSEPGAVYEGVCRGDKSHDVLAWHESKGEPPGFGVGFESTRFGR
jgi:FkbM family methyltransferase